MERVAAEQEGRAFQSPSKGQQQQRGQKQDGQPGAPQIGEGKGQTKMQAEKQIQLKVRRGQHRHNQIKTLTPQSSLHFEPRPFLLSFIVSPLQ